MVVFSIIRETACSECGQTIYQDALLRMEGDKPLCMECADLDHLIYLHRGNAALTRRAVKHSRSRIVVVRWSRTRKRYERQGVLVGEAALERAEDECAADVEVREARRERKTARRAELDIEFVKEFASQIREMYPGCPKGVDRIIAEHACRKHSGRVGRSAAAKRFEKEAVSLAVAAHVRHCLTNYDELLAMGHERSEARQMTGPEIDDILSDWLAIPSKG